MIDQGWPSLKGRFFKQSWLYLAAILLLPFVLLASNNTWIFPKLPYIDSWLYSGFHLHLHAFLERYSDTYYAARVPWTVLGWVVHSVLPTEWALYVLHFFVFYVAVFSIYHSTLTLFSSRLAALGSALLLATQPFVLNGLGWDYVDGPYSACMLLSIAALSATALRSRWQISAAVWGVATSLMISLYIMLVVFVPIEIGMFLFLNRWANRRAVVKVAGPFLAGAAGTILVLATVNRLVGGPFLYFLSQFTALPQVAGNRQLWMEPLSAWVGSAQWLIVPTLVAAFCVGPIVLGIRKFLAASRSVALEANTDTALFVVALACIAWSCVFIVLQANHFEVLQVRDNINGLLPVDYLVVGGILAGIARKLTQPAHFAFTALSVVLILAPWLLSAAGVIVPPPDSFEGLGNEAIWIAAGLLLLAGISLLPSRAGYLVVCLFLAEVAVGAAAGFDASHRDGMIAFPSEPLYKQQTLAVFDASQQIGKYDEDAGARFWFNTRDPQIAVERAVNDTYLAAYSLVNDKFPNLTGADGQLASILPGDRIVFLVPRGNPIPRANAALSKWRMSFHAVAYRTIARPGVNFEFVIADAQLERSKFEPEKPLTPQSLRITLSAATRPSSWPIVVRTAAQPWSYAGRVAIPTFAVGKRARDGVLRIKAKDVSGEVWIGVLTRDQKAFAVRTRLVAGPQDREILLSPIDLRHSSNLVIENGARPGASNVTIESVGILIPKSAS